MSSNGNQTSQLHRQGKAQRSVGAGELSAAGTKERPILFSSPMVRAILKGHKTQTRRVIRKQPIVALYTGRVPQFCSTGYPLDSRGYSPAQLALFCPYGRPGDRLWVRETFRLFAAEEECACYDSCSCQRYDGKPVYYADTLDDESTWKPSIFMPRWASRITLEITDVRVERLREISEADAIAEGVTASIVGADLDHLRYRAGFQTGWNHLNAKRGYSWESNPFVWVVSFQVASGLPSTT